MIDVFYQRLYEMVVHPRKKEIVKVETVYVVFPQEYS